MLVCDGSMERVDCNVNYEIHEKKKILPFNVKVLCLAHLYIINNFILYANSFIAYIGICVTFNEN